MSGDGTERLTGRDKLLHTDYWTKEEEDALVQGVREYGEGKWEEILKADASGPRLLVKKRLDRIVTKYFALLAQQEQESAAAVVKSKTPDAASRKKIPAAVLSPSKLVSPSKPADSASASFATTLTSTNTAPSTPITTTTTTITAIPKPGFTSAAPTDGESAPPTLLPTPTQSPVQLSRHSQSSTPQRKSQSQSIGGDTQLPSLLAAPSALRSSRSQPQLQRSHAPHSPHSQTLTGTLETLPSLSSLDSPVRASSEFDFLQRARVPADLVFPAVIGIEVYKQTKQDDTLLGEIIVRPNKTKVSDFCRMLVEELDVDFDFTLFKRTIPIHGAQYSRLAVQFFRSEADFAIIKPKGKT